ncbi:hypothetical protein MRX96_024656 [Rhipicephalus microplus]
MEELNGRPAALMFSNCETNEAPSNGPDFGLLPRIPWQIILDHLDAEARLAVADLGPYFEELVNCESCMRTVHCGVNSESAALRSLLQGGRANHVRTLKLTNCIVTNPDSLLACVALCERLTELHCVGCPLDTYLLLKVVTECLPSLERLYWSLRHRGNQGRRLQYLLDAGEIACLKPAFALERVYVEVERGTPTSYSFLAELVHRFPSLKRLHVHEVRRDECCCHDAEYLAYRIASCGGALKFSTDGDVSACERHALAATSSSPYSVCRNATHPGGDSFLGTRSPHWVFLDNFVQSSSCGSELNQLDQLVLNLDPLLARSLGFLLSACSRSLTELNLSAFHFREGLVVFNAGAASDEFRQLRALSVAPCALVPHGEPLQILAQLCTRLEELDVRRSGRDDDENSVHCPNCSVGLILRHSHLSDPAFRNWKYALRRLTLYNVKLLEPLHPFPCAFNVSELRLCGVDFLSGNRLGLIVRTSPHLTSLLVQHDKLPLFGKSLRRELTALRACAPSQLRSLSLLSKIGARTVAVARFADDLLTAMPLLVSLHVHYAAEVSGGFERRVTWVRRVRGWFMDRAERCTDVVIVEEDSGVLCCTSTFVGMEKPQNRNFCRL